MRDRPLPLRLGRKPRRPPSARTPRPRGTRCAGPARREAAARRARTARATTRVTGASTSDASHPRREPPAARIAPEPGIGIAARLDEARIVGVRHRVRVDRVGVDVADVGAAARCRRPSRRRRVPIVNSPASSETAVVPPLDPRRPPQLGERVDEILADLEGLEHRLVVLVLVLDHHVVGVPAAPQRLLVGEALARQAAAGRARARGRRSRRRRPARAARAPLAPTARARRRCRCRRSGARSAARRGACAGARAPPGGRCAPDPRRAARGSASAGRSDRRRESGASARSVRRRASSRASVDPESKERWCEPRSASAEVSQSEPFPSEGLATLAAVITAHTDVVGSLLRPPELLEVRERFDRGEASAGRAEAGRGSGRRRAPCALQEEAGIEVVTDGEMRRLSFQSGLPDAVDGFGEVPLEAYLWGDWHGEEVGDRSTERPAGLGVREPLRRRRHIAAEDFTYLRGRATAIAKVTLTSPSLYANLWSPTHSRDAYPTLDAFLEDVAAITRDEIAELARLGCTYIQLDAPHYPLLIDARTRAFYESQGWSADRWLDRGIELDNWVMQRPPGRDVRLPPVPREPGQSGGSRRAGTSRSRGACSPGSGPTGCCSSTTTSGRARSSRSTRCPTTGWSCSASSRRSRAGGRRPRSSRAASARRPPHVDLERLAISPQCGFATSIVGNAVTSDDQRAKLETLAQTAASACGRRNARWWESWPPTPRVPSQSGRCQPLTTIPERPRPLPRAARPPEPGGRAHHGALRRPAGRRADSPGVRRDAGSSSTWRGSGRPSTASWGRATRPGHLAAVLAERLGLPGPGRAAFMRCHDKLESRRIQAEAVPEATPAFAAVDLDAPDAPAAAAVSRSS